MFCGILQHLAFLNVSDFYVLFNKRAGVFYYRFKHDYKFNRYTALLAFFI
jgi:hypothetical protein